MPLLWLMFVAVVVQNRTKINCLCFVYKTNRTIVIESV